MAVALVGQQPDGAFQVGFTKDITPSLYTADAVVNVVNTTSDELCLNVYTADALIPDGLFACCSVVLQPKKTYVASSNRDLLIQPLNFNNPSSMKIKLVASVKTIIGCNPSAIAGPDQSVALETSLRSGLHASLGSEPGINNVAFQFVPLKSCVITAPGQPCRTELDVLTLFCGFVLASGSATGICRPPQVLEAPSTTSGDSVTIRLQSFFQ